MYMNSQTDLIKDKLNILDVVGQYVKLEKAGRTYKGKSPFNNEKTPSFFVSPEKGFFYCFSSGKGGDIFSFVQEIEKVDFRTALAMLAERAGVELDNSPEAKKYQDERDRLFHLLDLATKFYEVGLRKNREVVDYLLSRGLNKETIIKFRIGFARDSWRDIYEYLKSKKFTDSEIERAGLAIPKQGAGYYDRFRSRIMFPLMDGRGRVVGFSGRIFNGDEKSAKYINSPEGPLFDKSKVLYGYHTAKSVMSKQDYCILVEGQLDVLMSQQTGYENTVAISGTGLTDSHIAMIKRFTDQIYLALDSDKAGIKATRRSVLAAYAHGMQVKIIVLREGEDPADTIKRSSEAWDVAIMEPHDYIDYRIKLIEKNNLSFDEKQKLVQKDLFEIVFAHRNAITREHLIEKIALFLGIPVDAVRMDFYQYIPDETKEFQSENRKNNSDNSSNSGSEMKEIDSHKKLLLNIHYVYENFPEKITSFRDEISEKYKNYFHQELDEQLIKISKEDIALFSFVSETKKPAAPFSYFNNLIFSLLRSLRIEKMEDRSRHIQEKIRKEQIINPGHIPVALMRESNILRTEIQRLRNDS